MYTNFYLKSLDLQFFCWDLSMEKQKFIMKRISQLNSLESLSLTFLSAKSFNDGLLKLCKQNKQIPLDLINLKSLSLLFVFVLPYKYSLGSLRNLGPCLNKTAVNIQRLHIAYVSFF